ncbi:hypothetical protein Sste5346_010181 [Sporothrix stenoceras]|uniref:Beta-galactosidase n=1 Tax=Sporothrix stenoceras TaxID=5173 RepID=A0ABR3YI15_9PEZI
MEGPSTKTSQLRKVGASWQLLVDGKPYLILGAELQNSSMSSAAYMDTVWEEIVKIGVNTVLGVVAWEDIEPKEGKFDFGELDAVIFAARKHKLRLILTWFGSFKNGMSCYVPTWVKTDALRFPRMRCGDPDGSTDVANVISIFNEECVRADAKAFTMLMEHLKQIDGQRTVILVQVENEVGLLGDSRDHSKMADTLFHAPVPAELSEFLVGDWDSMHADLKCNFPSLTSNITTQLASTGRLGSWEAVFGASVYTDEIFMSYYYALYVEHVAAAGKKVYDIPLFTNAWLPKPGTSAGSNIAAGGNLPGDYPSGGPVSTVLDIWQKFAPTLDFFSPDIYTSDYLQICNTYTHRGQALFIPEQRRDEYGARRAWAAIGTYRALGVSPFGIDTLKAKDCAYTKHYHLLASVSQIILKAYMKPESIFGFFFDELNIEDTGGAAPSTIMKSFQDYALTISRAFVPGSSGPGAGIIIELENDRFLLIGCGFKVEYKSTRPGSVHTGILRFLEKSVADPATGELRTERKLNGDESRSGLWANMPNEVLDYAGTVVPICIPARTMIAEVTVYSLSKDGVNL